VTNNMWPESDHDESPYFLCHVGKVEEQSQGVMRNGFVRNTSRVERMELARVRVFMMYSMLDMKPSWL
jgi:hypothetical protein